MTNLSQKSQELLSFLKKEYIENGYMYSGSWLYTSLKEQGYSKETIHELQDAGKIQKRDCDDYAFELSASERGALITDHNLCSAWYEKGGNAFLTSIQEEVRNAAEILHDKDKGLMTVRTMKAEGTTDQPERMEVSCPFSIGQVIDLEYDLPKKLRWNANICQEVSPGRRVGQFMVTDVIHNLMVYPRTNMLEVQSLCDEFNKFYPRERTMMLFEDNVLKRMKNKVPSLSEQILSASARASEFQRSSHLRAKLLEPEL